MDTVVLATSSQGKIAELTALLAPTTCIAQRHFDIPEIEETGLSFIENAILKARHACQYSPYPTLADDSGLVIEALQGQPGIYSARFSGKGASDEANMQKVLSLLADKAPSQRQAYFYCALALVRYPEDPTPILAWGRLNGLITLSPQGTHGFGYDPIFFLPDQQCTMAELPSEQKNILSHRAQALHQLWKELVTISI